MAGDNNLEGAGKEDLDEMKEVGSNDRLKIVVQFDTEQNKTTRYLIEKNGLKILQEMPGVNTGDPKILTDFIKWGINEFPAQHYLINIWNHGGGWENLPTDYDYESLRASKPGLASKLKRVRRSIFRNTIKKIDNRSPADRAIAIDVGAADYLDNMELRTAIFNALPDNKKFDILGCDACLMNMLEIAFENKDVANIMVGSEETEPGTGWPYTSILKKLSEIPNMSPSDLAKAIAQDYGEYYENNGNAIQDQSATQSALDLTHIQPVAESLNDLANVMIKNIDDIAGQVLLARQKAQKFDMPEYIDLISFLDELIKRLPQNKAVADAAKKTLSILKSEQDKFIIANTKWGPRVERASGVSIYFPEHDYLEDYGDLAFSKQYQWKQFLKTMMNA